MPRRHLKVIRQSQVSYNENERSVEMTKLLEKVFVEASKLPTQEPDAFATWMLEELASERRWAELFAKSTHAL